MEDLIETLLETLQKINNFEGQWKEKRDEITAYADKNGYGTDLQEFTSWFEEEQE